MQGEILVLHHPTTISTKYQAMVHVGSVRQTASIIAMDKECLRTGDKAIVHFRFIKHPEYLKNGLKMVCCFFFISKKQSNKVFPPCIFAHSCFCLLAPSSVKIIILIGNMQYTEKINCHPF